MMMLSCSAYMFNDVFDLEVDRISNPARPLPSGALSTREVVSVGSLLLVGGAVIILGFGSAASFLMALVLCGLVFAYSAPPLRLRRFFLAPYFTIATSASLSFLLAYSFWGGGLDPASVMGAILIFGYGSGSCMVKEFKDIEGDSRMGVRSLPVALGLQRAVRVTIPAYLASCLLLLPFYWLFDLSPVFFLFFGTVFLLKCRTSYDLAKDPFDMGKRTRILAVEVVSTILLFLGIAASALVRP
jgi:4-hydroxybenzoate polyprenyltransferase